MLGPLGLSLSLYPLGLFSNTSMTEFGFSSFDKLLTQNNIYWHDTEVQIQFLSILMCIHPNRGMVSVLVLCVT